MLCSVQIPNTKELKENISSELSEVLLGNIFSDPSSWARKTKEKIQINGTTSNKKFLQQRESPTK